MIERAATIVSSIPGGKNAKDRTSDSTGITSKVASRSSRSTNQSLPFFPYHVVEKSPVFRDRSRWTLSNQVILLGYFATIAGLILRALDLILRTLKSANHTDAA
ncbi:hypothetical protein K239x_33310 [Planctomycetes bacterium K23_9]|uniref:Uncharacterized protein n=1 Tax=Stieleria marina TaxID=1930275 RepID=A0A517NW63_9BACT|nr:hypothetical protein K239x_33310 [Planctomycetes bacterium K23_9]